MIVIEIPYLPPKALSPNWRGHWAARARASKQCRRDAYLCALATQAEGKYQLLKSRFNKARLKVTIYIPDKRHIRDGDNALASVKPFIDGCVDAQIIPDDDPSHLTIEGVEYVVQKEKAPITALEFKEVK